VANFLVEESEKEASLHDKIDFLIGKLKDKGYLGTRRPPRLLSGHRLPCDFVYENTVAIPFYIPVGARLRDAGYTSLKIWVSEPDSADFTDGEWDFSGSYLFLTELHLDNKGHSSFVSGCSALKFIVNATSPPDFVDSREHEVLGRFDERNLAAKLIGLGAKPGPPQRIETLYRIRYMTDEQYYKSGSVSRRVHDIVGYPLFIAL
jgi:hypothetical protein